MSEIYHPYEYQKFAEKHIIDHKYSGLFLDMGLGKTVITLSAINKLMYEDFEISKVLIVGPKYVSQTVWNGEIEKWKHLRHLKYQLVLGTSRTRIEALKKEVDIYIINRENLAWLVSHLQTGWFFDMVVLDELSSYKSHKSLRFRSFRIVRPRCKRLVGLTGTPTPNGLIDLWSQMYLLDKGKRLGKTITQYREAYFTYNPYKFKYSVSDVAEKMIHDKISDICISMKSEDYIDLPKLITVDVNVILTKINQKKYDEFEKEQIINLIDELGDEKEVTAMNALTLSGKLAQFANGAVYDSEKNICGVHEQKIECLGELLEQLEGENVLLAYNYKHDLKRIQKAFGGVMLESKDQIDLWNEGKIKLMLVHPQSASHGINLQYGGFNTIWFGLPRSRELYDQLNARLLRRGQLKPVKIFRIIAKHTVDEVIVSSLEDKKNTQDRLLNAVKAMIKKYSH